MSPPVAAIILAAGASSRLGQSKQLLLFRGETMIGRSIRLATEAGASPVFVVLGANRERIRAAIPPHLAFPVINDAWHQGVSSSIRTGLSALEASTPDAPGVLILGCDQPRLTAGHLRTLLSTFTAQSEPVMVASAYADTMGIPAVFPREVFDELHTLAGDRGARSLFTKPTCALIAVPFPGGEIDIDLPADIAELE